MKTAELDTQPDLTFQGEGSIFLLGARTDAGRAWIAEHIAVTDETMTWGGAIVVEWRYIKDIVEGARADGLVVEAV